MSTTDSKPGALSANLSGSSIALRSRLSEMQGGSGAFAERRARIIKEATHLIAEWGLEKFSLGELARRADVSLRTIYNAFENRENVIALSMWQYFEGFAESAGFETSPATLLGALDRVVTTYLRSREVMNYHAAVSLYFSPQANPLIREVMQNMSGGLFREWFRTLEASNQLNKGISVHSLVLSVSHALYSVFHEWSVGQITNEAVLHRMLEVALILMVGATVGDARAYAESLLVDLKTDGPILAGVVEIAQSHADSVGRRVARARKRAK